MYSMKNIVFAVLLALGLSTAGVQAAGTEAQAPETKSAKLVNWVKKNPKTAAAIVLATVAAGYTAADLINVYGFKQDSWTVKGYNAAVKLCTKAEKPANPGSGEASGS
jgi:hypothetical protein